MSPPRIPPSQGYPLSSLFILIALFAVLAAHLSPLATAQQRKELSVTTVLTAPMVGAFVGACFGVIIGLYHYQRQRGVLLGLAMGVVMGAICGVILAISVSLGWQMVLTSMASAVVLLGVAAFARYMNDEDPVSSRKVYEKMLAQRKDEDVWVASTVEPEE